METREKNPVIKKREVPKKESKRLPYGLVGKIILGTIAMAGFLAISLAAPNVFQAVKIFEKRNRKSYHLYRSSAYVRRAVDRLAKRRLIVIFQKEGQIVMRLTEKGRRELLSYQLKEKALKKWHWDGKWRLMIFDIAEKRRWARDRVRSDMQSFGFVKLQDSVWVYPYECEEAVTLLKAQYKIGKELLYIVAGEIEEDGWLKKKFSLK